MARALHAGEHWTDTGLVFTTEFGGPVDPLNVLGTIEVAAAKVGVKDVGVHTLRHSAAVAWLEAGVHIKAVADLLRHSSIAITGDIYGHTSDATTRPAIDGLTNALGLQGLLTRWRSAWSAPGVTLLPFDRAGICPAVISQHISRLIFRDFAAKSPRNCCHRPTV